MHIEKKQLQKNKYCCQIIYSARARDALQAFLSCYNNDDYCLFIPGFIGFSPIEGSGLYDPVTTLGINHRFYLMDEELKVNLEDLDLQLKQWKKKKILLVVHYWGYVDPQYEAIIACARANQCIVIEDMAHAVYTEYVDHSCGHHGDVSFYSLHKMFPFTMGGMLKIQNPELFHPSLASDNSITFPVEYDFVSISKKRKENSALWEELLAQHPDKFKILRPTNQYPDSTPQTFPVCVLNADRYKLYSELNNRGYGVISLYHTLISPLQDSRYEQAQSLSKKILNFPVHQDVSEQQIRNMYSELLLCYSEIEELN